MSKLMGFLSKPRNMVFSILVMFALVVGLLKVSFSYYVEDSTNGAQLKLNTIDNRLSSRDINDGVLALKAFESKVVTMSVTSYNEYESAYKIFYDCSSDITLEKISDYDGLLGAGETDRVSILVANPNDYAVDVNIFVINGYVGNSIVSDYRAI